MIRCTIVVYDGSDVYKAYEDLLKIETFKIIKLQNFMNDPVPHVLLNVIYNNSIVGEIIIRNGEKPANFYTLKLLTDLSNSFNILEFQEHVWNFCDRL